MEKLIWPILKCAVITTEWIEHSRQWQDGGLSNVAKDRAGPYLGESWQ